MRTKLLSVETIAIKRNGARQRGPLRSQYCLDRGGKGRGRLCTPTPMKGVERVRGGTKGQYNLPRESPDDVRSGSLSQFHTEYDADPPSDAGSKEIRLGRDPWLAITGDRTSRVSARWGPLGNVFLYFFNE